VANRFLVLFRFPVLSRGREERAQVIECYHLTGRQKRWV